MGMVSQAAGPDGWNRVPTIGRSLAGSHHVGDVTGEVGGEDVAERGRVDVSVGAGGVGADDEVGRVGEAAARVHSRQRCRRCRRRAGAKAAT